MNAELRKTTDYNTTNFRIITPETEQISEDNLDTLLQSYKRALLVCSSKTVNRYIFEQDEEWSVTVRAFYEAIKVYDREKGAFWPFASTVVKRRLTDYLRAEGANSCLIPVSPDVFNGDPGTEETEDNPINGTEKEARHCIAKESAETGSWPGQYTIADEIEAVQSELKKYGFSFYDLAECSPKAAKSKEKCATAAATLLNNRELIGQMRQTRQLPMKALEEKSGISRKVLDKHRRYIIAATEIFDGEYPLLREYLEPVRKAMKSR